MNNTIYSLQRFNTTKQIVAFFPIIDLNETPLTEYYPNESIAMMWIHREICKNDEHRDQRIFIQNYILENYKHDFPQSQWPLKQIQDTQDNDTNLEQDMKFYDRKEQAFEAIRQAWKNKNLDK